MVPPAVISAKAKPKGNDSDHVYMVDGALGATGSQNTFDMLTGLQQTLHSDFQIPQSPGSQAAYAASGGGGGPLRFEIGSHVELRNLNVSNLNGRVGAIIQDDPKLAGDGRMAIKMRDDGKL